MLVDESLFKDRMPSPTIVQKDVESQNSDSSTACTATKTAEKAMLNTAIKAEITDPVSQAIEVAKNHSQYHNEQKILLRFSDGRLMENTGFLTYCRNYVSTTSKGPNDEHLRITETTTALIDCKFSQAHQRAKSVMTFINSKLSLFKTDIQKLKFNPQLRSIFKQATNDDIGNLGSAHPQTKVENEVTADGLEILSMIKPKNEFNLPPVGDLAREELVVGSKVWIQRTSLLGIWAKGTILGIRDSTPEKLYKVRFESNKINATKLYSGKQLAYDKPASVIVPVGTRIIARYTDQTKSSMYAGIVAEPPKCTNNMRYLVFFDDGYAQYINHHDINVVHTQSNDVADDVHDSLRDFIKNYLAKYPERPMVKLQINQITKTELNNFWCDTKVIDVDASMVKMLFLNTNRTEWIYRGSTRLKLLYDELITAVARRLTGKPRRHNLVSRKPHEPYVEYTTDIVTITDDSEGEEEEEVSTGGLLHPRRKTGGSQYTKPVKNTARKSTDPNKKRCLNERILQQHVPDTESHKGKREIHVGLPFTKVEFQAHVCNIFCKEKEDPAIYKGKNPLTIPLLLKWQRQIRKYKSQGVKKTEILYRSPCGRFFRSLSEIYEYLLLVQSRVTIDFFSMNLNLVSYRQFRAIAPKYYQPDVTQGRENVPVSVVNSLSNSPPPYVEYSAERFPGQGVHLNLDKNFLSGCDCTDNCQNPELCNCQRLTNYAKSGQYTDEAPYEHRRLMEPLITGIYECNELCKCGPQCGNRVVQHGLQVQLQMFKTQYKGWGIRCLHDIEAGMFVCVYAGQLLTEQGADEDGNQFGDEYLAELDHIEVVEKTKEGYESDVPELELELETIETKREIESEPEEPVKKKARRSRKKTKSLVEKKVPKKSVPIKNGKTVKKVEIETSDSENNMSIGSDSDFESPLRTTASSTYATRSQRRNRKKNTSLDSSSIPNGYVDSSSSIDVEKVEDTKELPDIKNSFDYVTIAPAPLSPKSAEIIEKAEIKRKPKFSGNNTQVTAKKSFSSKHSVSHPVPPKKLPKYISIRDYYGEDGLYIMDAKSKGNIGRYLNHSCSPNVFVQNVFVDTHDLRFPWVAFFAQHYIIAGTELTWDYNYEVGSVDNKVMYCYCDSENCRGRLL